MDDKINISVVTVCLNAKKYIESTLNSIIKQDYPYIQLVVIDGNSSDGTQEIISSIIKKYQKYKEIIYISENDNGIYNAMNKGISFAKGEFVIFMNVGDSFVDSKTISEIVKKIRKDDEIIYGNHYSTIYNKRKLHRPPNVNVTHMRPVFCHQASLTRVDLLKKMPFDESYKIIADAKFFLNQFEMGHKFRYIDIDIANFNLEGISSSQINKKYLETLRMLSESEYCTKVDLENKKRSLIKDKKREFIKRMLPHFIRYIGYKKYENIWEHS